MSSNIRVTRKCDYCGSSFIAKTTVTKNCSLQCAQRAYKQKQKFLKVTNSDLDTGSKFDMIEKGIGSKDYLSVHEAAKLFGVSERTIRRLVALKKLPVIRFGMRVVLVKRDFEKYLKTA